jgi:BMFP domain-containing protein YqiC
MSELNPTEEVVNTPENTETPETPEIDVKKLQELERNKTIALEQERKEKKALAEKLAELEKFKADLDEKEKKKKGQYEELITEKDAKIQELQEKASKFDEYMTQLQTKQAEELEALQKEVPETLKEKYSKITEKLDVSDRIDFYRNITADLKKEDFSNKPKNEG